MWVPETGRTKILSVKLHLLPPGKVRGKRWMGVTWRAISFYYGFWNCPLVWISEGTSVKWHSRVWGTEWYIFLCGYHVSLLLGTVCCHCVCNTQCYMVLKEPISVCICWKEQNSHAKRGSAWSPFIDKPSIWGEKGQSKLVKVRITDS